MKSWLLNIASPKYLALATLLLGAASAEAKTIYVNGAIATGGNGANWATAYKYLRDALDVSMPGDNVWVAKGTYYPDDGKTGEFGNRELSFDLNSVKVYGGFAGTETALSQRVLASNPTILSGGIWEGMAGFERYWTLHVVILNTDSTLDGLIIEKGRANGDYGTDVGQYNQGGGILAPTGTKVTLKNCTLRNNLASEAGGAVWGKVIAEDCEFSDNTVDNQFLLSSDPALPEHWLFSPFGQGGAISGDVDAKGCQFLRNKLFMESLDAPTQRYNSRAHGGAIFGQLVNLSNCLFESNAAYSRSRVRTGPIDPAFPNNPTDTDPDSDPDDDNFDSNVTGTPGFAESEGGAVYGATVNALKCTFKTNVAHAYDAESPDNDSLAAGGGIYGNTISLDGCMFDSNKAFAFTIPQPSVPPPGPTAVSGGGAVDAAVSVTAKYCQFIGNRAGFDQRDAIYTEYKTATLVAPFSFGGGVMAAKPTVGATTVLSAKSSIVNSAFHNNELSAYSNAAARLALTSYGGGLYTGGNGSAATNCAIVANKAYSSGRGGGVFVAGVESSVLIDQSPMPISNCTFFENLAELDGAALFNDCGDTAASTVSEVVRHGGVQIFGNIFRFTTVDVAHSRLIALSGRSRISNQLFQTPLSESINIVQGGFAGGVSWYLGCYVDLGSPYSRTLRDVDPLFVSTANPVGADGIWGTADDGLRLTATSPAIGVGDPIVFEPGSTTILGSPLYRPKDILDADEDGVINETIPMDLAEFIRVQDDTYGNRLDLGAYEFGTNRFIGDIRVEVPLGTELANAGTLDFGTVLGLGVTKTVYIKNTGVGSLKNLAVTVSGANQSDFTVSQPVLKTVPAGGSTTFTVNFTPKADGLRSIVVQIASTDPDESPYVLNVKGNGGVSDISVEQPAGTALVDGTAIVSYGNSSLNTTTSKTFTVKNTGIGTLAISSINVAGAHASNFKAYLPASKVIAPGGSTTFRVDFTPSAVGTRNALVSVLSNDPDAEGSFDINVTGVGTDAPEIKVAQPTSSEITTGGSRSYGSVNRGLTYTKTFTITNVGVKPLNNIAVSISGSTDFILEKPTASQLGAGENVNFKVSFKPTSVGTKSAVVKIKSNDADENPFVINVSGTGTSASKSALSSIVGKSTSLLEIDGGKVTVRTGADGLTYLVLTVKKSADWALTNHRVEVSSNLVDWYSGKKHTTVLVNDASTLRVQDKTPVSKTAKRYIRLK